MTESRGQTLDRAAALRHEFNRAFAEAPRPEAAVHEDLLAIRLAGDGYALRLAEIRGVLADRRVVALPSSSPGLLGVAAFRGEILPVYSLRGLLAYPTEEAPRWLVLAGSRDVIGLAFDQFDGYLRVPRTGIAAPERPQLARPHVREVIQTGEGIRPVLSVPSLLEAITRRARPGGPSEER